MSQQLGDLLLAFVIPALAALWVVLLLANVRAARRAAARKVTRWMRDQ